MELVTNIEQVPQGAVIVRLYTSGDTVRAYVRAKGEPDTEDSIFPGEELQPGDAFEIARSHNRGLRSPIYVELLEGVRWDARWGDLHGL